MIFLVQSRSGWHRHDITNNVWTGWCTSKHQAMKTPLDTLAYPISSFKGYIYAKKEVNRKFWLITHDNQLVEESSFHKYPEYFI